MTGHREKKDNVRSADTGTPGMAPGAAPDTKPAKSAEQAVHDKEVHDKELHDHDDALADEWGRESFPSSDPPGHY